ncbi:acid protease, partial [Backusella circina FSU 941]
LENIDLAYLVDISVGTPPQPFKLLLDTGSSSTWVPVQECGSACGYPKNSLQPHKSSTFHESNLRFHIKYGDGFAKGYYVTDNISINNITVKNANFVVSDSNDGELTDSGADGILGLGPDTLSTFNNKDRKIIPTLVTSMFDNRLIDKNVFSIYFKPVTNQGFKNKRINGELVFGGVEEKHIKGPVTYAPITKNKKFKDYWAVDCTKIKVGQHTKRYRKGITAIVDTGSTMLFLPQEIIREVFKNVSGLHKDFNGQYTVPCKSHNLPDITMTIGKHDYTLKPEHYVITSGALSYSEETCYTYLHASPSFVDMIIGYAFLQQHLTVYDNENHRVGF